MLNVLRPTMTRLFTPVGKMLARTPVTPNAVTVVGTVGVAGGALGLFPIGELFPGALTCTIFVLLDMVDGVLARIKGTTGAWGAFLDSTMDRLPDAAIFSGLVIWFMLGGLWFVGLLFVEQLMLGCSNTHQGDLLLGGLLHRPLCFIGSYLCLWL